MKRNDSTFKELVSRLQTGELTRIQAADAYGIPYNTLSVWLIRSKIKLAAGEARALHGAAVNWGIKDPARALETAEAVDRVLRGEISALAAAQGTGVSARTVAQRVRKARLARGEVVQHRRTRYVEVATR